MVYQISVWIYNVTLHPLAEIPGPKLWAISRVPFELSIVRGRCNREICALHEKYGDMVRTGPKSVSYIHPDAWGEIMDRRGGYGKNDLQRDRLRLSDSFRVNGAAEILTADDATHSRQRKVLAHAFSDRALREEHQPLIQRNVDLMIYKLRSLTHDEKTKGRVDLANWLNLATFDIIGDLTFGEVFGCLEKGEYHPWVKLIAESVHIVTIMSAATQFPWLDWVLKTLTSRWVLKAIHEHHALTLDKVGRRLAKDSPRGDFLSQIMKYDGTEKELSRDELMSNAMLMIPAGSETSSAGIASCVYQVLAKPEATRTLMKEINSKFKSEEEITFEAVSDMKYLDACINEAFRLYPPIAIYNPRVVGVQEGCNVMGAHVPYQVSSPVFRFYRDPFCWPHKLSNCCQLFQGGATDLTDRVPLGSITGRHTTALATSRIRSISNRLAGLVIRASTMTDVRS